LTKALFMDLKESVKRVSSFYEVLVDKRKESRGP